MSVRVHGIASCDTCRKARRWLDEQGVEHAWVDLRADGVEDARVARWLVAVGGAKLVNRRSTTWRQLPESRRPEPDAPELLALLVEQPTLVKRPVFERDGEIRVGFDDAVREWLTQD